MKTKAESLKIMRLTSLSLYELKKGKNIQIVSIRNGRGKVTVNRTDTREKQPTVMRNFMPINSTV